MPGISIPASLYGAVFISMARGVVVTMDSNDTTCTLEVYHGLGASCFPFPVIQPASTWAANISLPATAHCISYSATVAYFNINVPVVPGAGKDVGTVWDVCLETRHSLAR